MIKNLKDVRLEKGKTQKEIAVFLSITQQTYSDYETGRTNPDPDSLIKIADFLGVTIDYLLGREDDFGNVSVPAPSMSTDAQELLRIFESLDPMHREQILEYARYFAERSAKAGKKDKRKVAT